MFSGTLFVFLGQRYYKIIADESTPQTNRIDWMKANIRLVKSLLIVSFIAFSTLAILYVFNHPNSIYLFVLAGLISVLYVVKIGPWNLREIPFLKAFCVTAAYFIFTLGLHMLEHRIPYNYNVLSLLILIFSLTILFDIPDRKWDTLKSKTFAQVLGVRGTILLSAGCVFVSFLLRGYNLSAKGTAFNAIWVLIVITFYIKLPKKVDSEFYLAFFGDGILGLFGLLIILYGAV